MKPYLILGLAAVMAMAACTENEGEDIPDTGKRAISFAPAYVQGMTRDGTYMDWTTDNLPMFYVTGYIGANSTPTKIFDQTLVMKLSDVWTYEGGDRYWMPDNHYFFTAYWPTAADQVICRYDTAFNMYTTQMIGVHNLQNDIIFSQPDTVYVAKNGNVESGTNVSSDGTTYLTFDHIMTKALINVTTDFASGSNLKFVLTGINLSNCDTIGNFISTTIIDSKTKEITVSNLWVNVEGSGEIAASSTTDGVTKSIPFVLFPEPQDITVTITGDLYQGNVKVKSPTLTGSLKNFDLNMGNYYIFTATITEENVNNNKPLNPIEFKLASVSDWNSNSGTIDPTNDDL